ncbi:MAG: hypothetical protein MI755_19615 [Sphingomonadales bacterium]|nr:hypothetical protein [Sphingomonadales bacterium]
MTKNRKKKRHKAPEAPADGLTPAAVSDQTTPEPIPFEDMEIDDWEVKIYQTVLRREKKESRMPDWDDIFAMEEPLHRLMGGLTLFHDLAYGVRLDSTVRTDGLVFLVHALSREADRLYRLRHGREPNYG